MLGLMQDVPLSLTHAFERGERLWAGKELVSVTAAGERDRTTYGAWAARVRRLAGAFDDLGLGPDARVATFAWNTRRHLELYFAVPCSGRVLHTVNIRLFAEQVSYVMRHAQDEAVFVDRGLLALLWPLVDELPDLRYVVVMEDGSGAEVPDDPRIRDHDALVDAAQPATFHVDDEDRAAALCYTSGTTGDPKGVLYSHRSTMLHAVSSMLADGFGLREADRVLPVVPMFHANAWGLAHASVLAGASLVMPGPDLSPAGLARLIEEEGVTATAGVPTIWMGMLAELDGRDLSRLERVMCGGSAVPPALNAAWRAKTGKPILQAWGMTETSPVGSVAQIKSTFADASEQELDRLRGTIGLPAPFVEVRIVEPGSTDELPWDGEAQGELQVRGPWIAAAYYEDERSPVTEDDWLMTGDVATIDGEGYMQLVDRTKDVIKSGGEWISSVALENAIMAHPDVREAAVIGVPDAKWGERPLACVVVEDGTTLDAEGLRGYLDGRVAKWWLPERIELIDEVPKTSVGKFSKKTLRERFVSDHAPA